MLYIFDIGNVLLKNIDIIHPMSDMFGIDFNELYADLCHYDFPIMDGTLSIREYYNHLEHQFGVRIDSDPWYDCFHPVVNKPVLDAIEHLRKCGNTVVSGTNNCDPHWRYIMQHSWDKIFERNYVSHLIGLSKPSRQFFEYILEKEHAKTEDTVFVDDYEENVVSSRSLGIRTIHYTENFDDSTLLSALL